MIEFKDLQALVGRVTRPDGPPLYRELYRLSAQASGLEIHSAQEWQTLPLLTKEHLERFALRERSFVPHAQVDSIRASSGTSGKPPLFSPQASMRGPYYHTRFHPGARAFLTSVPPPHLAEAFLEAAGKPPLVVTLDPQHIEASVALARLVGVDSIFAHSFLMPAVGAEMSRQNYTGQIAYAEVVGEPSTRSLVEYLKKTFPRAALVSAYGATEVEGAIGAPCTQLQSEPPFELYHEGPGVLLELLNEKGEVLEPKADAEGELVVTAYAGEPFACPLIRYRIGDVARVVEEKCPAHGLWSFTVLGRKDADFIRIPGGMLRADEIERVLRQEQIPSGRFEVRSSERPIAGKPAPAIVLYLDAPAQTDWDALAKRLATSLRVGPSFTYAQGVQKGFYHPLECAPLGSVPAGKKRFTRSGE